MMKKLYYLEYRGSQESLKATHCRAICKRTGELIAERTYTTVLGNKDEVTETVHELAEWKGYTRTHPPKRKFAEEKAGK